MDRAISPQMVQKSNPKKKVNRVFIHMSLWEGDKQGLSTKEVQGNRTQETGTSKSNRKQDTQTPEPDKLLRPLG